MLIDIIFFALLFFACIKGLKKGFIVALFSVVAFIIGIAAALKLSAFVAAKLSENVEVSGKWLPVISFILVFLGVVLIVNLGAKLIQKAIEAVMLGWLNRIAGVVLYILIYTIIYSIFLFYAVQLHIIKEKAISASVMYPYIQPVGPKIIDSIGSVVPFFKDLFTQLEAFFTAVANKMQH